MTSAWWLMGAVQARAQAPGAGADVPKPEELVRVEAAPVTLAPGGQGLAVVRVTVREGWHVNADPPSLDYLIPTVLELSPAAGLRPERVGYPPARRVKFGFEEQPLAVYDGTFELRVPLRADPDAAAGARTLAGTLRFQSCNDQVCLAPAEVPVSIAVRIEGAATPGGLGEPGVGAPATSAPAGAGGAVQGAPPATGASGAAAVENAVARLFERGGWVAFLGLFLMGLALNLTPCVYPMLGVTVSIFGARRAAPVGQVLLLAVLYVLGIAAMYSALGLLAAFTGGLFGGFLQSPWVLAGIGVLLVGMALSMFGLYELQVPASLTSRLGGTMTAGAASVFLSGLVVGVFAAPCVGPPIVALLALVAQKGDAWFGLSSFFTLSLGLGAPYLVLATFSGGLQRLPRSGEWMVWVKKLFGVILLGVGGFYLLLAVAPRQAAWVVPLVLVVGGVYLGFLEKSGNQKPTFRRLKWVVGAVAILLAALVVGVPSSNKVAFAGYAPQHLEAARASGQPVLLDFSAEWCVPCHELERVTFTDRRVVEAARRFRTLKVDLTRYNTPEAERFRKQYDITGVPTLVFLDPSGQEVRAARIEGFVPPEMLLEAMRLVPGAAR
jgi:thiol:disulfide interchange protein DsbD